MKNRMVNTDFWTDGYIDTLSPNEKLLFLYFLTNGNTSICGIYQIPLNTTAAQTGLDKNIIINILFKFEKEGKMIYRSGWIAIKNFIKNQNQKSPTIQKGISEQFANVPIDLKKWVLSQIKGIGTLSHLNPILNTNSNLNSNLNTNGDETENTVSECMSDSDFEENQENKEFDFGKYTEGEKAKPRMSATEQRREELFNTFWDIYPRKVAKKVAYKAFISCLKNKDSPEEIITATQNFKKKCEVDKTDEQWIKHPATFLRNDLWKDYLNIDVQRKESTEERTKRILAEAGETL
jgi:hypothetical protein